MPAHGTNVVSLSSFRQERELRGVRTTLQKCRTRLHTEEGVSYIFLKMAIERLERRESELLGAMSDAKENV